MIASSPQMRAAHRGRARRRRRRVRRIDCRPAGAIPTPGRRKASSAARSRAKGREAGVWVIAETNELPTQFTKIVVTADDGRFMLPELPNATYNVWVRGYGLADSKPVPGKPGQTLEAKGDAGARARPRPPRSIRRTTGTRCSRYRRPSEFPGKGIDVNGIPATFRDPGAVHRSAEAGMSAVPSARQRADARRSGT